MPAPSYLRLLALWIVLCPLRNASPQDAWLTVPERSEYQQTSRLSDVQAAIEQLLAGPLAPRLKREVLGSSAGRAAVGGAGPLPIESLRLTGSEGELLRVLVVANIHGGEVEGKETVLLLLREFAAGEHADLLKHLDLWFVPIYNVDGNEAIGPWNRPEQNGPALGVGERHNGQGLDLNRDLIKVEAPETAALLGAFLRFDPHLLLDLHTTNGTDHGYPLTYAGSLVPGLDPDLFHFAHMRFLPNVAAALRAEGLETFDYGNLEASPELAAATGASGESAAEPGSNGAAAGRSAQAWRSFDYRPRYLTNYVGLHNRIPILSEAFSYADFKTRIAATRSFVLAVLAEAVEEQSTIARLCSAADERAANPTAPLYLPRAAQLERPWPKTVLLQRVEEFPVTLPDGKSAVTRRATWELESVAAHAQVRFEGRQWQELPAGWALIQPSAEIEQRLQTHGIRYERLAADRRVPGERFILEASQRASRPFQGHRERSLSGRLEALLLDLPAGSLLVPRAQPRGRLAAWLLEPESPDSLTTWNCFDGTLEGATPGSAHPVLRLSAWPGER
jgi:Zinc carboxypeptidase